MARAASVQLSCCRVDLDRRRVDRGEDHLSLSTKEGELLSYLVAHAGRDLSRDELYREVWGYAQTTRSRTLDITVARLRKKVESNPKRPQHLLTLAGIGYRMELSPDKELLPTHETAGLLGREQELVELGALLDSGAALISLLGPPGVGKRTLANQLLSLRPGLQCLSEPNREAVAGARQRQTDTPIVVTARCPLRMQGEHRFPLRPLASTAAVQLLAQRLATGSPSRDERRQLEQTVEALGGNPRLIVELARSLAARVEGGRWAASLKFVRLPEWIETRVLSWKGAFRGMLEDDWSKVGPNGRELLQWAAEHGSTFSLEDLSHRSRAGIAVHDTVDLLAELCDYSTLISESPGRFRVPVPMKVYVLARNAATAAPATRS